LINQQGYSKDLMKVLLGGWGHWQELHVQDPAKYPTETGPGGLSTPLPINTSTVVVQETPTLQPIISTPEAEGTATALAFATETGGLERISLQELKALQATNDVTIIDVRSADLYDDRHIKGAVSIPESEIMSRLQEVPKEGNVVLYCQ
jgi:hypothetical protein